MRYNSNYYLNTMFCSEKDTSPKYWWDNMDFFPTSTTYISLIIYWRIIYFWCNGCRFQKPSHSSPLFSDFSLLCTPRVTGFLSRPLLIFHLGMHHVLHVKQPASLHLSLTYLSVTSKVPCCVIVLVACSVTLWLIVCKHSVSRNHGVLFLGEQRPFSK